MVVRRSLRHPLSHLYDLTQLFEHFDSRGELPHVGDGRFFEGHGVTFGVVVAHGLRDQGFWQANFHSI